MYSAMATHSAIAEVKDGVKNVAMTQSSSLSDFEMMLNREKQASVREI